MIYQGDALERLKTFAPEYIDCCITSPPYWALRDYKVEGQLGLEPTFQEYIDKLCAIFDEVKRVLKKTGTCWVVLGDTYYGMKVGNTNGKRMRNGWNSHTCQQKEGVNTTSFMKGVQYGIPDKSLCMIPERFAIKMIDNGWCLRNKIVWFKPNCMPSSAKDRFTVDWEYVFFFTKSQRYYFETQYEPIQETTVERNRYIRDRWPTSGDEYTSHSSYNNSLGRIKRCVWKISTKPFSGAHFAVFAPDLVEPMIKAGCPSEICSKCGFMKKIVYEETKGEGGPKFGGNRASMYGNSTYSGNEWQPKIRKKINLDRRDNDRTTIDQIITRRPVIRRLKSMDADSNGEYHGESQKDYNSALAQDASETKRRIIESYKKRANSQIVMTSCNCGAPFSPGVVLDPFAGAGTTGLVAMKNARNFVGIELNPDYIKIAEERLRPYTEQTKLI